MAGFALGNAEKFCLFSKAMALTCIRLASFGNFQGHGLDRRSTLKISAILQGHGLDLHSNLRFSEIFKVARP